MLPLVTCLCLTTGERAAKWIPQAVENFEKQTYPRRQLLIAGDGVSVWRLIPGKYPEIRERAFDRHLSIGSKRNQAIDCETREGIICHWDDDDYNAPERIADQVASLVRSQKAVTGYSSMNFTDGLNWWLYSHEDHFAIGTSLCYRRDWWEAHPFPDEQHGEDGAFQFEADQRGQLVSCAAGPLMVASVHAGNTAPKLMQRPAYQPIPIPAGIGSPFEAVMEAVK